MMRATQIAPAGTWAADQEKDWVLLDFDRRHRRRVTLPTESGAEILLDLRDTVRMRDGDGLMLEGGGIIRVAARPEQLIEITAPSQILTRIAWHLGNRHLPV